MPLDQLNAEQSRGHQVFAVRCAQCHHDRTSDPLHGPALRGVFKKQYLPSGAPANDDRVTATVLHGRNLMLAQPNIDQQDLDNLLAYLHTPVTTMDTETSQSAVAPGTAPAEDTGFRARRLPGVPAGEAKGMLPGMALIGVYLLMLAMLNAFAAIHGAFGPGAARYGILGVSTIMVVGVFGFLRLRRWGWAVTTAGFVVLAAGDFYAYTRMHAGFFLIRALFSLVFFLYLSRTEVRERLR